MIEFLLVIKGVKPVSDLKSLPHGALNLTASSYELYSWNEIESAVYFPITIRFILVEGKYIVLEMLFFVSFL